MEYSEKMLSAAVEVPASSVSPLAIAPLQRRRDAVHELLTE
jgi:hypothetical protein